MPPLFQSSLISRKKMAITFNLTLSRKYITLDTQKATQTPSKGEI
jgi:hypothetical protein